MPTCTNWRGSKFGKVRAARLSVGRTAVPGICMLVCMLACRFAYSAEVSAAAAREAVAGWAALGDALTGQEAFDGRKIAGVATYAGADGKGAFHVVSFAGGGFAVTSGDTEIAPILAYSDGGEFVATDENPLWVMLTQDVAGRTVQLAPNDAAGTTRQRSGNATSPSTAAWARLRAAATPQKRLMATPPGRRASVSDVRVAPLCKTRWYQEGRGENRFTPGNKVCGCVATAMAQVMKYFEWPKEKVEVGDHWYTSTAASSVWRMGLDPDTGTRYDTLDPLFTGPEFGGPYDWANMPNLSSEVVNDTQRNAIGLLCRDCGIAVRMHYNSSGGSASYMSYCYLRLLDQFDYKNAVYIYAPSSKQMHDAMIASFDLGLPCAVGLVNHAVVSDGYGYTDSRLFIHFNWGFGNKAETAWYAPPEAGESNGDYPVIQDLVYNIYTPEMCGEEKRTIVSGRVLDDGVPAVGVTVTATNKQYGTFTATTGETGIYAFLLPYGTEYAISVSRGLKVAKIDRLNVYRYNRSNGIFEPTTPSGKPSVYTTPKAEVTNLPGTDLNLEYDPELDRPWLDERAENSKWTGAWSSPVSYGADGRALVFDNTFTPSRASTGNVVTVELAANFCEVVDPSDPGEYAQCGVRLSTNGCFQVWSREEPGTGGGGAGELGWVDVAAEGITPVSGEDYTLRATIDYSSMAYSVEVKDGDAWIPFRSSASGSQPASSSFPLGTVTNCVTSVDFVGDTHFTSLYGEGRYEMAGFVAEEALALSNNVQVILSAAQAAWLNCCAGGKATVAGAAAGLSEGDFSDAYLLNLDITDGDRSYAFRVSRIDVGTDGVSVAVTLTRHGSIAEPINGVLKFYGAETLSAFRSAPTPLGDTELTNATFGEGETATAVIPKDGNLFYGAKIEGK